MLTKCDLFEARTRGYATYRIPGLVVTTAGTILAYCAARKSGIGDWADIDIALRRSTDGGDTWEPARIIVVEGAATADNPVAIADRKAGVVHFLYQVDYARCFYMHSEDDGATFSEPAEITSVFEEFRAEYDWNVIAPGPGHGIQLHSGRLLVPVWLSTGGEQHRPSCVSTIYSDDCGNTWHRGEIVTFNGDQAQDGRAIVNPSETVAIERGDGRVLLNIRSESMAERRLVSLSEDGAAGWTKPAFDESLFESVCMASIAAMDSDQGRIILFANPDSGSSFRENLIVKLSYDDGKTWPHSRVLDPGVAAYSDMAVTSDGTILCLYERGGFDDNMFDTRFLTLARFDLSWILEETSGTG
jgi:sialidase-1